VKRLALILLLVLPGMAGAQQDVFDQLIERFVRPQVAVGGGALHLFYLRKANPQEPPQSRYRSYTAEKGWSETEGKFGGAHLAVAVVDATMVVFRVDNYSIYCNGEWQRTPDWPFEWAPAAACTVGADVWVFGAEMDGEQSQLRAARLRADDKDAWGRPEAIEAALALPEPASDLDVIVLEDRAVVFWHQPTESGNAIWTAAFDGTAWAEASQADAPYESNDFTVAAHDGAAWLFCRERGKRLTESRPLMSMVQQGDAWSQPVPLADARDSWLDFTFDLEAVSYDGALHVFRATMSHLVLHRMRDGRWEEPQELFEPPPWAIYRTWWLLLNVAAGLCLLPFVVVAAFRGRSQGRVVRLLTGKTAPTASWGRRVAALLIDFFMVEGIYNAGSVVFGAAKGGGMEDLLVVVGGHLVVFFAYFLVCESLSGQTLGKWGLNIMVVDGTGNRATFQRVLIRNLLRPWLPFFPVAYLVGSILVLVTPRSQRLGDLLAGTLVIELPRPEPAKREKD